MKISEMTNDDAARVLITIADPIGRICDDEDAVKLVYEYKKNVRKPLFYVVGRILPRLMGHLLEKHKHDVYQIISALSGVNINAVGGMNFVETVKLAQESYDDVLASFFPSSALATKGGEKE